MPTPASDLPPDLAKLAGDIVDDVGAKTGMPMPPAVSEGEDTEDGATMPSASGEMGVPMAFIDAAMAIDKEGLPREQVARILSGMLASNMITADDDPKKVGREFKVVTGTPAKLLKAVGAISDKPAPAGGGEVLT